jgi:hypothetical protein
VSSRLCVRAIVCMCVRLCVRVCACVCSESERVCVCVRVSVKVACGRSHLEHVQVVRATRQSRPQKLLLQLPKDGVPLRRVPRVVLDGTRGLQQVHCRRVKVEPAQRR